MTSGINLQLWAYFSHPHRRVRIGAIRRDYDAQKTFFAAPVLWVERADSNEECPALLSLEPEEAQLLANALWDAGIRPLGAAGSAGQLAATEAHLEDMRSLTNRLVGKLLTP